MNNLNLCSYLVHAGFISNPIGLSVNRGDEVNLNCNFSLDRSKVNISWNTPADIWLTPIDQTDTDTNVTQSTLMFTAMNSSYAGDYFCMAYVDGFAVNSTVGVLSLNCMFACADIKNYKL